MPASIAINMSCLKNNEELLITLTIETQKHTLFIVFRHQFNYKHYRFPSKEYYVYKSYNVLRFSYDSPGKIITKDDIQFILLVFSFHCNNKYNIALA